MPGLDHEGREVSIADPGADQLAAVAVASPDRFDGDIAAGDQIARIGSRSPSTRRLERAFRMIADIGRIEVFDPKIGSVDPERVAVHNADPHGCGRTVAD